jgi:hypothetical protein
MVGGEMKGCGKARSAAVVSVLAWAVCCGGHVTSDSAGSDAGGRGSGGSPGGDGGTRAPSRCGNGAIEAAEECDRALLSGENCATVTMGARPAGVLRCSATCTYDVSNCIVPPGMGGGSSVGGGAGFGGGGGVAGGAGTAGGGGRM